MIKFNEKIYKINYEYINRKTNKYILIKDYEKHMINLYFKS